jgi:peroxiredoxin
VGSNGETLATVADRELAGLRSLAVGQAAPEINGRDVDGKPMVLSEFRGRVVLLDFGTHEHCGGCKLVYPRQRELVETHKGRPFAVLGINSGDRLEILKELAAKKEVTWRCWWDGDDFAHTGPITTAWNIKGYPTFVILDHRGVIRFKDLHPFDPQFAPAIEALIKEAEADRR